MRRRFAFLTVLFLAFGGWVWGGDAPPPAKIT